jgi:hypothetical protein
MPLRQPPRTGISQAIKRQESERPEEFIEALIKSKRLVRKRGTPVPPMMYEGKEIPLGHALTIYKPGSPVDPEMERGAGGFRDMSLISRPPDSKLVSLSRGFDSRHHVWRLPLISRGNPIAMKLFLPGDEYSAPKFAEIEAANLTTARKGHYLVPYVRPLRSDVSARFDKKTREWVPDGRWGRLFTEMPHGYVSINRINFERMTPEQRRMLVEELGFAMGYLHRRRGVHGDPTLANLLIKEAWMSTPHSLDNIRHLDAESFHHAGEMPDEAAIRSTFIRDVGIVMGDAKRLGLVKLGEEKEMFHNPFWRNYVSHWVGGDVPSRLATTIERLGPEAFFTRMPKVEREPDEILREQMRKNLYEGMPPEATEERPSGTGTLSGAWVRALRRLGYPKPGD